MKLVQFFASSIGKKIVVALTGLFMILFLIMHLVGNLEIFSGPKAVNDYAAFLRTMPKVLWTFRILLIVSVVVHIWLTISLTRSNMRARPHPYREKKSRKATIASRTMLLGGVTVLLFVVYHLLHLTFGITHPEYLTLTDSLGRPHVYNMMVHGFSQPLIASFYVLAQIFLAFHLSHGISSAARTLGVKNAALYRTITLGGIAVAVIIAMLFISIPLSVLSGLVILDV